MQVAATRAPGSFTLTGIGSNPIRSGFNNNTQTTSCLSPKPLVGPQSEEFLNGERIEKRKEMQRKAGMHTLVSSTTDYEWRQN